MEEAQLHKIFAKHGERLAALEEGHETLKEQMAENNKLTAGIYELSANMKNLTEEVKRMGDKLDTGLEKQGERIGKLEAAPGQKWDKFTWAIIAAAVSALMAFVAGKVLP